ncbi:MAG: MFS transporter [Micrococcales bacterium]|nr:MFS transporter [Micrococcales bacterium]
MNYLAIDRDRLLRARLAVLIVFAMNGANFAAFASRIPEVKTTLGLSAGQLGITLLGLSVGSLIGLPASGWVTHRFGAARSVQFGLLMMILGGAVIAVGVDGVQSRALVMAGLFVSGLGIGVWDVAMNLEGAGVERLLGVTVMPWFHAAFSGGTVLSALLGAGLSAARVPVWAHLVGVFGLAGIVCWWAVASFLPRAVEEQSDDEEQETASSFSPAQAWLEPRTLLIGLMTLVAAFTEGTANDWVAVAMVEGYDLPHWAGILGFATFLSFMTIGRIGGARLLDRHGRVPVLRFLFGLGLLGSLLVVFGGPLLAFVGAAVWGLGASLGFPVGMSAAADDPRRAAARMSVVSTIGYLAFLGGPPLLGLLGDHVGVLRSLLVVGVMLVIAFAVVPAAREPEEAPAAADAPAG